MTPRERALKKKYGITVADYDRMLEAQNGVCWICKRPPKTRRLAVDHDHKKKGRESVRALLCHRCNRGLRWFSDSPERLTTAAEYLRQYEAKVQHINCSV
jgi:hypothetical protein